MDNTTLDKFNEDAQQRFQRLKQKLKLDIQAPAIDSLLKITKQKIEEIKLPLVSVEDFHSSCNTEEVQSMIDASVFIDDAFDFIESLKLSPQSSLAIGLIISANKTTNKSELQKAIAVLNKELEQE